MSTLATAQRARLSFSRGAAPSRRALAVCALAVSVAVVVLVWLTPQGLYHDSIAQLHALQQYVAGQSPTFNTEVTPSPDDLSRDRQEWITWWPPGMGLVLLPLSSGVPLATSVRLVAAIAYASGCLGWALWCAQFQMPRALLMTLAVAMPFSHYATTPLFQFYTESFVWGCVPWVLLGALALARVWQQRPDARLLLRCALLGLAAGLLYWLKYSAVFVSGGVLLFVAWLTLRKWHNRSGFRIGPLLAVGVPLVATLVALIAWNKHMGASANSFTSTRGWYVDWHNLVDAVASFPLAMTDAEGLLGWLLFKPGRRLIENPGLLRLAALPCGCALFWLVWRRRHEEPSTWLARCVATASALGVFIVWTFSGAGDHAARHVAGAAVMLVPVAIQEFSYLRRGWLRQVVLVVGAVVIAVPLLYGAASVAGKAFRARGYRAAASGFYNPQLSRTDAAAVIRRLHAYASPQAVWYVCDGATAIDLPGRSLIRWADFLPIDTLARETHRSSVPMRINLLLPPHFEQNGKGAVIRASFPQAQAWAAINIAGAEYTLWSAKLN